MICNQRIGSEGHWLRACSVLIGFLIHRALFWSFVRILKVSLLVNFGVEWSLLTLLSIWQSMTFYRQAPIQTSLYPFWVYSAQIDTPTLKPHFFISVFRAHAQLASTSTYTFENYLQIACFSLLTLVRLTSIARTLATGIQIVPELCFVAMIQPLIIVSSDRASYAYHSLVSFPILRSGELITTKIKQQQQN